MKIRRRKYLVDSGFQVQLILIFVTVSLIGSIAGVTVFNLLAMRKLEELMWSVHIRAGSTGELLKPLFIQVNLAGLLFFSVLLLVMAVWMIRKAAGPLYRMSKDIARASHGDLTAEITLRHGDSFRDTSHDLDRMLKSLRSRFKAVDEQYARVSEALAKCSDQNARAEDYASAASHIEKLEDELKKFQV